MLIDLTFDVVKFIVQQVKSDPSNTNFSKLSPGEHMGFDDSAWNYWTFNSYSDMVNWVTINMPEQVENIREEEMM